MMVIWWFLGMIVVMMFVVGGGVWVQIFVLFDVIKVCVVMCVIDFGMLQDVLISIVFVVIVIYGFDKCEVCQVDGVINLMIGFKIVMLISGWNGKYIQGGCGGGCGMMKLFWCDDLLCCGYVCFGFDMGYIGNVGDWCWVWNNIQLQGDFGFCSMYVVSFVGKVVVVVYYGRLVMFSYYWGCLMGGWQVYYEVEFYLFDFVGIVGGLLLLNEMGLVVQIVWMVKVNLCVDGSEIFGVFQV